jgi:hypothetical protein
MTDKKDKKSEKKTEKKVGKKTEKKTEKKAVKSKKAVVKEEKFSVISPDELESQDNRDNTVHAIERPIGTGLKQVFESDSSIDCHTNALHNFDEYGSIPIESDMRPVIHEIENESFEDKDAAVKKLQKSLPKNRISFFTGHLGKVELKRLIALEIEDINKDLDTPKIYVSCTNVDGDSIEVINKDLLKIYNNKIEAKIKSLKLLKKYLNKLKHCKD